MKIEQQDTSHFKDMIVKRINRNKNFLGCFVGGTGSGKSYSGLALCEELSNEFGVEFGERNIVFTPKKLMELINSDYLQKGSCILFDESGVSYSARQWQSINNQLINYLIETFRYKNYIVIFTVPNISFIDKVARNLLHCLFETCSIDYARKFVEVKPFMIDVSRYGKAYYKYPRYYEPGSVNPTPIHRLHIYMASKKLRDIYEVKREAYISDLYKMIEQGLEVKKFRGVGRPKKIVDTVNDAEKN